MTDVVPLKRSMRTLGALLITLSSITPASSVFIIAPGVVQQAGTGAFLSFAFAAVACVFTSFIYAELASAFPLAGGEYSIIGRTLGSFWGILTLGTNLISVILSIAVLSVGISVYIKPLFPEADPVTSGILTLFFTTLCSILNLRTNAIITGIFLFLELATLVILAWLGFSHIEHGFSELTFHPVHLNSSGVLEATPFNLIGLATAVAMFAYNGYGQAVYLGEETHNAPKLIARTILLALTITVIAEAAPVTAVLMGAGDSATFLGSSNILGDFITLKGGKNLNAVVSLSIALAILNANIAFIVMVSRILYSTGRDRIWTKSINRLITRVHPKFDSPWVATLVCGGLSMAACFIDQKLLLVITGTGLVAVYCLLAIAVIAGRITGATSHAVYKMPFFPAVPVLALAMMGYVFYANFLDDDVGRSSLIATGAMMLLSALYYAIVLRRKKSWSLRMPPLHDMLNN